MWQEYSSNPRRDLYILVKAVKDRGESLDHESRKLLDRILLEFEEYGYGFLDDDGIQRRLEKVNRIEQLCAKFNRNLREDNGGELFTPEEVDGLPKRPRAHGCQRKGVLQPAKKSPKQEPVNLDSLFN